MEKNKEEFVHQTYTKALHFSRVRVGVLQKSGN